MSYVFKSHPSHSALYTIGKSLREKCPRSAYTAWQAPHERPDPLRTRALERMGQHAAVA